MINLYLILSLVTYIFILLRWIFRRRFSVVGLSDNGNANNGKKGKARLFVPCPLSSISCRGGCYRSDLKSSKQVVYLRGVSAESPDISTIFKGRMCTSMAHEKYPCHRTLSPFRCCFPQYNTPHPGSRERFLHGHPP